MFFVEQVDTYYVDFEICDCAFYVIDDLLSFVQHTN